MKDFYTAYTIGKQGGIISAIDTEPIRAMDRVALNPLVLSGSIIRLLKGDSFRGSVLITSKTPTGQVAVKSLVGTSF